MTEHFKRFDLLGNKRELPKDGEPCSHPGCLSHISHPCEGCGRIGGQTTTEQHECEWRYAPVIEQVSSSMCNTPGFYCTVSGCDEYLLLDQAEAMLNEYETLKKATDALSAAHARLAAKRLPDGYYATVVVLKAYADILEGK